jgi:hypothetical protein
MTTQSMRSAICETCIVAFTLLLAVATTAESQGIRQAGSGHVPLAEVPVKVFLEDGAQALITIGIKRNADGRDVAPNIASRDVASMEEETQPGALTLDLSALESGSYSLFMRSPGYSTQILMFDVKDGEANLSPEPVTLFRKRYAVLRYAVNTAGAQVLVGANVESGRCVVGGGTDARLNTQSFASPSARENAVVGTTPVLPAAPDLKHGLSVAAGAPVPHFGCYCRVVQQSKSLYLDFRRYTDAHCFTRAPDGAAFERLVKAPSNGTYTCGRIRATPGLTLFSLFSWVSGESYKGDCYGKLLVESVTEQPPPDLIRIDSGL